MRNLSMEVRHLNLVAVDEPNDAYARASEIRRGRTPQPASTNK